jgi:hypothetical protein
MPKRTNPFQQLIAMVVELLEDGSVVTESIEYPDPAAGNPREVDITVVRGQVGGKPIRIGIECTKLGRRATQPWVEMQYGKHNRLQVVDFVILVSDSGFSKTARAVAEQLGYLAIHPNITTSELADVINQRFRLGLKMSEINLLAVNFTASRGGVTSDFKLANDGEGFMFLRSDGSNLVRATDFELTAAAKELAKDPSNFMVDESYQRDFTVPTLIQPAHDGERLHVVLTDGTSEVVVPVDTLDITARVTATNTAKSNLEEIGNYGGHLFATGQAPIGDSTARFVVTDVPGVGMKGMARFQYEVGKKSKVVKKRNVGNKRGEKRN